MWQVWFEHAAEFKLVESNSALRSTPTQTWSSGRLIVKFFKKYFLFNALAIKFASASNYTSILSTGRMVFNHTDFICIPIVHLLASAPNIVGIAEINVGDRVANIPIVPACVGHAVLSHLTTCLCMTHFLQFVDGLDTANSPGHSQVHHSRRLHAGR